MNWLEEIITLYVEICDEYSKNLWQHFQRFSNYADLSFSDEEVLTIYMQGIMDGKTTKKQIYKHAKNYWNDLFPLLPSYGGFVQRVNKLSDVFVAMVNRIQAKLPQDLFDSTNPRLIDSMPIIDNSCS